MKALVAVGLMVATFALAGAIAWWIIYWTEAGLVGRVSDGVAIALGGAPIAFIVWSSIYMQIKQSERGGE